MIKLPNIFIQTLISFPAKFYNFYQTEKKIFFLLIKKSLNNFLIKL